MDRTILHCDMNSFFCSVELLEHPELKDRPVAVGGSAENRHGIILAKNEPAKKLKIQTGEALWQAYKKCPELIVLPPHHEKYQEFCHVLNQIYLRYTDLVEPFSVDESWLDVTGSLKLFGKDGPALADEIRETVYNETGLTQSIGVSFNKIFAKMGSDYKKPYATTVISRDNFRELLWPLPAGEMFFVGSRSAKKLEGLGIRTIGDIAQADPAFLKAVFGKAGEQMHKYACGDDDSPVAPYDIAREIKSVGNGFTFKRNLRNREDVQTAVTALADKVGARLRKNGLKACGVKVDIKDTNFISKSRQMQLDAPTELASDIASGAMALMDANWDYRNEIRLLTVTAINVLESGAAVATQLSFFDKPRDNNSGKQQAVEETMDKIRSRYGKYSIVAGSMINNDLGIPTKGTHQPQPGPKEMIYEPDNYEAQNISANTWEDAEF